MTDDICGYEDTSTGDPCKRTAGWGRDVDEGYCKDHAEGESGPPAHRPTKLTKKREENIAQMIEDGHSMSAAARSNGITVQTFFNWMDRGADEEETICADFFERITRARGHGEKKYVDALVEIARENDDTATLMTMLKSRYPDEWGDANRGEQTAGVNVHLEAEDTIEVD